MKKWVVAPGGQCGAFTDMDGDELTFTSFDDAVTLRMKGGLCSTFSASVTYDIALFLMDTMLREVDDITPGQAAYEACPHNTRVWEWLSGADQEMWHRIAAAARSAQ